MYLKIKKIISWILLVSITVTNNGILVFASSVDNIVNESLSAESEIPNYFYEDNKDIVEEYQNYLESQNPDIFDAESKDDFIENEEEIDDLKNESEETDYSEEAEEDTKEESSEESESEVESEFKEEVETEEETVSTKSETEENDESIKETDEEEIEESETENTEVEETISTNSEIESIEETFINEATSSEVIENIEEATKSELSEEEILETLATSSEVEKSTESEIDKSTTSEIEKEIIVASISKISWKLKKVLISTYTSINVESKNKDKLLKEKLATYANVIIENNLGKEKVVKVNLKWKLFKQYEVNAKSKKTDEPISRDEWRKDLKVEEFLSENNEDVIISTSNIAKIENIVNEENTKYDDKLYVIKILDETENEAKEFVEEVNEIEASKSEITEITETENVVATKTDISVEEIEEPTVAGFNNSETEEIVEIDDETDLEIETEEENYATDSQTDKVIIDEEELKVEAVKKGEEEITDDKIKYFDLQNIYLYKIDVNHLANEIIELINKENEAAEDIETLSSAESNSEENNGIFNGLFKLLNIKTEDKLLNSNEGANESEEQNSENELLIYLSNAKVDVIEEVKIEPLIVEVDTHLLSAGATHSQHQVSEGIKGKYITVDNMYNSVVGGATSDMLDLSPSNTKIRATGSDIFISGSYFLPSDIKISNKWIIENNNTLVLCLNGHNVKFATAGCIKGDGRVVVCNCGDTATITTDGPNLNWQDRWYASTSETYTKWNEHSLFSGGEVGIYAKDSNIIFNNINIKNEYNSKKSITQMEDTEIDEAEYSGDGSILWGKNVIQVYGVKFTNNKATRSNGVAINSQLGEMIIEECTFEGNKSLTNRGGAVAFNPKSAIIHNCTFKNNVSFTNGGALYGKAYKTSRESQEIGTKISKTVFEDNAAKIYGGAIALDYLCEKGLTIDGDEANKVVFKNNYAGASGGAISVTHIRTIEGQDSLVNSYEDDNSINRLLNINYATFEGNAAKSIIINRDTGKVIDDIIESRDNYGGAIYLNSQIIKYQTHPSDEPLKEVNINNSTFKNNYAKGYELNINAQDVSGNFSGDTLAKYNVGNYGGAIYANNIKMINIKDSTFDINKSMTGGHICVKKSSVSITGGELSKGKAYNSSYEATEFYKKVVSPGGGAIYIMDESNVSIANNTTIKANENAIYLDGGSIDLGPTEVKDNIGEYLIGYSNYKENKILFSGVDIQDHVFNETRKDYASTLSDASTGTRDFTKGHYQQTKISFKDVNLIKNNKRNYYTKNGSSYTSKNEYANLVMTSADSNIQLDLSEYLFDVPYTSQNVSDRIGLYYDFDPTGPDEIIAYKNWNYEKVKVIDEGGIWTNYFEIDNSQKGEWAEDWKFYIDLDNIRMSPNIVQVKFDSFIEDTPRIKPQYYNFRKLENEKMKIATPTEIIRRDIRTPGKTLLGFLGVDKRDENNDKYGLWDFDNSLIDPTEAVNDVVTIVLVYTNDTIKIKPCGCENGKSCSHDNLSINHSDRGVGTNEAENRYLNYIEVATYPQLSYLYNGKKTQYVLSKDLHLTAEQAKEFIAGGMVLNLNGHTLSYDTSSREDVSIFDTTINDSFNDANDSKVMICGIATPGATKKGTIVANGAGGKGHNGAFILSNTDVYLNNLNIKNINSVTNTNHSLIKSTNEKDSSYIELNNVTIENVDLKGGLIDAGEKVVLNNVKIDNLTLGGDIVKLRGDDNKETILKISNTNIENIKNANSLLSTNREQAKTGTKITIASTNIINNTFKEKLVVLNNEDNGQSSSIELTGDVNIIGNTLTDGSKFIDNATSEGEDKYGLDLDDNIKIRDNTIPDTKDTTLLGVNAKTVTFKGNVVLTGNKTPTSGLSNAATSTVKSGNNTMVYLDEVSIRVTDNFTRHEWKADNTDGSTQTYNKPIFNQVAGTKLKASESIIKLSLTKNSEDEGQVVYKNWSAENIIGEKEAEATFVRDNSYDEEEMFDIYKRGVDDKNSDIYLGSSFVAVRFRLYNYKLDVDEREDEKAGYTQAAIQRVEPDVYTLLDTPQYIFDFSRTSIMWEGFAYRNSDGSYDYSEERLYPEKTTHIPLRSTRSVLISGYIYNYGNKRHVHEGNIELWTEARNEGHLQATNSYVFLHNDIKITKKLKYKPENDYYLCLNGHKLIIDTNENWFDSDTCKLTICDCKKTGSIVQNEGTLETNIINVKGGEFNINDITIGPLADVKNSNLVVIDENVKTDINNLTIKDVKMQASKDEANSLIEINTLDKASISNVSIKNSRLVSNNENSTIFSVNNKTNDSTINLGAIAIENCEVAANTSNNYSGDGYILKVEGYENVNIGKPVVKLNKSVLGAPFAIKGNGNSLSMITMNDVTFSENQKNYEGEMTLNKQLQNGVSANFAISKFNKIYINKGKFAGNKFVTNEKQLNSNEGAVIDIANYDSNLTVKDVTFDGSGTNEANGMYGIVSTSRNDDLFENITITNYNIENTKYMLLAKGTDKGPSGSYTGRTTFKGKSRFINNRVKSLVYVENQRADLNNENEGIILFNDCYFNNNVVNTKDISDCGLIIQNGNTIVVSSGSTITKTTGVALHIKNSEIRFYNSEINTGSGDAAAVYVEENTQFVVGEKAVVKGNKVNIQLNGKGNNNAKIKAIAEHPINEESEIYITVSNIEYNFFDDWAKEYISKYNYHSDTVYYYLPSDLFKLDSEVAKNRQMYISGNIADGKQKLWISKAKTNSQYATLIFYDEDIKGPKEITRQYVKVGEKTKLDRVQVDYVSTISQVWMTESDGLQPKEQKMWRLYSAGKFNDFEVENYEAGKTYYAYLVKKHIHKVCGPDSLISCGPNHVDNEVHTEDAEFTQVISSEDIIFAASRSTFIGLEKDLKITQAALDSMSNREVVLCLNGRTLTFEKDATHKTDYNFTLTNCYDKGSIKVDSNVTSNPLIDVKASNKELRLYNVKFEGFETNAPVIKMQDIKAVSENTTFTKIKTTYEKGIIDIGNGSTTYLQDLIFTSNVASKSAILDLNFNIFNVGKIGSIQIRNNTYTNKLLSLNGTGNMDSVIVENNTMIVGGGEDSYGAIYIANGANITYAKDAVISSNDASVNKQSKGGALSVYGTLNFNGNMLLEKNKAGFGGAIYVDNAGAFNVSGEAIFRENEADIGGAIYAKDWNKVNLASAIYDNNIAKVHGVVAFGGEYRSKATFKNHTRKSSELIYNINEGGNDSITLDEDTLFIDNTLATSIIYLQNTVNSNISISYLSNNNSVKSFVEVATGSVTIDNSTIIENTFNDSVFIAKDPVNVKFASISVTENKITNAIISVSGNAVDISNRMSFVGNIPRLGKAKQLHVSGAGGYFRAYEKISKGKKYLLSSYKNGVKVFEKWSEATIENYDNPQQTSPGKYMVTPENSDTIKLSESMKDEKYDIYKVGSTNSQDLYIGKEGLDFVQLRFVDPDEDNALFAVQNIQLGKETKIDKIDTFECDLSKQRWIATMSDGFAKTLIFTTEQTASSSKTITIPYSRPHLHKTCGIKTILPCNHYDSTMHQEEEYQVISNETEFANTANEYVYLNSDLTINSTINLSSSIKSICLNGYELKLTRGNQALFNTNNTMSICNCRKVGGITTTGSGIQEEAIIKYSGANLQLYNIEFTNISTNKEVIELIGDGTSALIIENSRFTHSANFGSKGAIYNNDKNKVIINNVTFSDNRIVDSNEMLNIGDNYTIGTLSFISNEISVNALVFNNLNNELNVDTIILKNNKQTGTTDSLVLINNDIKKINVTKNLTFESNNTSAKSTLKIGDNSNLVVLGTMSFIKNTAKNNSAFLMGNNSYLTVEASIFDNNKNSENGTPIVSWQDSTLSLNNSIFKNHANDGNILIGNDANFTNGKVYINKPTFVNNAGVAISINKIADGEIRGIKLEKNQKNKFMSILNVAESSVSITDFNVVGNELTGSAMIIAKANSVELSNISIKNNKITTSGYAAIQVVDANSIVKVKDLIEVTGNTTDISLKEGSYLKASDVVSKKSVMSFNVSGKSQKVFSGWDEEHIESFGEIASKSKPRRYAYTPENSGLFKVSSPKGYEIYKGGVGEDLSIYAGNKDSYSVLSFAYVDKENKETVIETQNVMKGATNGTLLDVVDTFEYELEHQTWFAPNNSTGAYDVKWEFKDQVISNVTKDSKIKYVRKHIHKVCGTPYEDVCDHKEINLIHDRTVIYTYATSSDPAYWPANAEYISLNNDIEFKNPVVLSNVKGICLNGHKMIVTETLYSYFIEVSNNLDICDCMYKDSDKGGIAVKQGVVLGGETGYGGLIRIASGGAKLYAYNIKFIDVSIKDTEDFFVTYHYAIENTNGTIYLERPLFTGITNAGINGLFKNTRGVSEFMMIEPMFKNMTINSNYPLFNLNNQYAISTISLIGNKGFTYPLIKVVDNVEVGCIVTEKNVGSTGQGIIFIEEGATLTLNENNAFNNNESQGGGVIRVAGTLIAEKDLSFTNNQTVKGSGEGGAIYIGENGKVITNGKTTFVGNKSYYGAAIYGENIKEDALKDMKNPYFENNVALNRGIIYWSGTLNLSTPTFAKHKVYNESKSEGVRTGLIVNKGVNNILVLTDPKFVNNTIANKSIGASAIYVNSLANGSLITGITKDTTGNTFDNLIYAVNSDLKLNGSVVSNNTFTDAVIRVKAPGIMNLEDLEIKGQKVTNAAVRISEGPVFVNKHIDISENITSDKKASKNILLEDDLSYLMGSGKEGAPQYIDKNSKMSISTSINKTSRVFNGWDKYNFENYDKPDNSINDYKYAYTPQSSQIFIVDEEKTKAGYELYLNGYKGDGKGEGDIFIGTKDDFVKLKYYNDVEEVEDYIEKVGDKEYYAYQNVAKNVPTKLDKIDTHEYEIEKQEWYVGYESKEQYDHLEKFSPTNPSPKVDGVNGVVDTFTENQEIKYHQLHIHKICGNKLSQECKHTNHGAHTQTVEFFEVNTIEELEEASGYAVLVKDIEIAQLQRGINLKQDLQGICLNGHTLMGDGRYTLFTINHGFTICDCKIHKKTGGITSDESFTQASDLFNINTSETVELYNIIIKNIAFGSGYAINKVQGNVYIGQLFLEGCVKAGSNGVIRSDSNLVIDKLTLNNNKMTGVNPLIRITEGVKLYNMSLLNNTMEDSIVIIDSDSDVDNLVVSENTSNNKGSIYVTQGKKFTTKEHQITKNKAKNGAGIYIEGTFESVDEEGLFKDNKATENGGAIYLSENAKLKLAAGSKFENGIAVDGSAIYAKSISAIDLMINDTVYTQNIAVEGAAVSFGGDIDVSGLVVKDSLDGTTFLRNINTKDALDSAMISSISFVNNKLSGSGIVLTNVKNGSTVKNISAENNNINSIVEISNTAQGNRVYVTNVSKVNNNTFNEAGFVFKNAKDVVLNNIKAENNTSAANGVILLKGATTKVYSIGEVVLKNNTNTGKYGAAITILNGSTFDEDGGLTITGNRSSNGGAIYLAGKLGVQAQGSKELRVSGNYINNSKDTKNILVVDKNSYVYATGKLSDSTSLGFTAGIVNATVFKYWNDTYINKYNSTDKYCYTPENSGLFTRDTLSVNAKQEFFKSGVGYDIVVKLGANFTKLRFTDASKKTKYATQNIERNVDTQLDNIIAVTSTEKWIAPNKNAASDYKWSFSRSSIIANYDTKEEYIYKLFTFSVVYTGGSKGGSKKYTNIEYGEAIYADENPFGGAGFKSWFLRDAISGLPREYKVGDLIKNICLTDGGTAYLDARWDGEIVIKFDPNSSKYGLDIPYNGMYEALASAGKNVNLSATYDYNLTNGKYNSYTYNTKSDGSGRSYNVNSGATFNDDITLYLVWKKETQNKDTYYDRSRSSNKGGSGGGRGGSISAGGVILNADPNGGPGVLPKPTSVNGAFYVDEFGNIRDPKDNIVGNIYLGDRVNLDGSFTAVNGITIYPSGEVMDIFGNFYNKDGSITTPAGSTYYPNGDVKDITGTIYHPDGTITMPDGTTRDLNGVIHHPDGSITLADGTTYFVDGTILLPSGMLLNPAAQIVQPEVQNNETPGNWYYDPAVNKWKFEFVDQNNNKITYSDEWIYTKNAQGTLTWYAVDKDGYMITGWLKADGEYYFMSEDSTTRGEQVKGRMTIKGTTYTFDTDTGALISGAVPKTRLSVIGAVNHVTGEDGTWKLYSTGERYFVYNFKMQDGTELQVPPSKWFMIDGNYYYFDEYGIPKTGLIVYDDKYYYLNSDGTMKEGGEVTIGTKTYVFDKATGACITIRQN